MHDPSESPQATKSTHSLTLDDEATDQRIIKISQSDKVISENNF